MASATGVARTSTGAADGARGSLCPRGAQVLPGDAVAGATEVSLARAAALYPVLDTRGAIAVSAARSSAAGPRGVEVVRQCGRRAAERTVMVELLFPRMLPSASLSESTLFVARARGAYRVWEVAH